MTNSAALIKYFNNFIIFVIWFIEHNKETKERKIELPDDFPEYIISMEDVDYALSFYANLAKKYCKEQFNGDLSLFEKIHLERRENA